MKNEHIYYKPKTNKVKHSPAQFSSPMLKQMVPKRSQNRIQSQTAHFRKGPSSGNRNLNDIIRKYNPTKPNLKPKMEHKQMKPKHILDSINRNINGPRIPNQGILPKRVSNQPQRVLNKQPYQKKSNTNKTKASYKNQKLYRANTNGSASNKFLAKNIKKVDKFDIERKRNFSPIESKKMMSNQIFKRPNEVVNVTKNNLSGQKIINPSLKQNTNDSLGGGSKINTKTGSMLNFGGGSKIPDNLSVISR